MAVAIVFSAATVFAAHPATAVSDIIQTKKVKPAKVHIPVPCIRKY
jgi:hypothetical protein